MTEPGHHHYWHPVNMAPPLQLVDTAPVMPSPSTITVICECGAVETR